MQRCLFEPEPFRRHRRRGRSVARGHPRRDMAGREYPDSVTGRSLLPWMGGEICRGVACCTVIITASCGTRTATAGSSTRGISSSGAVRPGKCTYSDMADDVNEEHELGPEADLDPSLRQLAQEFANRHEGFGLGGSLVVGQQRDRIVRGGQVNDPGWHNEPLLVFQRRIVVGLAPLRQTAADAFRRKHWLRSLAQGHAPGRSRGSA